MSRITVRMVTNHLPCGDKVVISVSGPNASILEIKKALEKATGVPVGDQKLMLGSISQLAMLDKRLPLRFTSCGTANSLSLVFQSA